MERVCKKCGAIFEAETKNTVCWECKRKNKKRIEMLYRSTRKERKQKKNKPFSADRFFHEYNEYVKANGYISYGKYVVLTEQKKSGKIK